MALDPGSFINRCYSLYRLQVRWEHRRWVLQRRKMAVRREISLPERVRSRDSPSTRIIIVGDRLRFLLFGHISVGPRGLFNPRVALVVVAHRALLRPLSSPRKEAKTASGREFGHEAEQGHIFSRGLDDLHGHDLHRFAPIRQSRRPQVLVPQLQGQRFSPGFAESKGELYRTQQFGADSGNREFGSRSRRRWIQLVVARF